MTRKKMSLCLQMGVNQEQLQIRSLVTAFPVHPGSSSLVHLICVGPGVLAAHTAHPVPSQAVLNCMDKQVTDYSWTNWPQMLLETEGWATEYGKGQDLTCADVEENSVSKAAQNEVGQEPSQEQRFSWGITCKSYELCNLGQYWFCWMWYLHIA